MRAGRRAIRIGTSGWHYDHWAGPFYPRELRKADYLAFYAECFDTVEINSSFYRLPSPGTFRGWRDSVPGGFRFAVKASRYITHMKRLKDPEAHVARFLEAAAALGDKRGPVLFQLPPRWKPDLGRLRDFLAVLPGSLPCAFEFRDERWFGDGLYDLLAEHGAAFCIYDLAGQRSPIEVTAALCYVRLHGPGGAYQGSYSGQALAAWARRFRDWRGEGRRVYCYFDNDEKGYAARDALRLKAMLGED